MHKPAIAPLVFSRLFPASKPNDPTSLTAHISRNIVPEVRSETVCFYGPIDCLEAQYPGLDYANPAHRIRLGRFPWHRRLFRVFDELRLSEHEIQSLCKWEGTRWARERYEKEEGVKIRDTTWDGIKSAVHPDPTATKTELTEGFDDGNDLDVECSGEDNRGEVVHMNENADLSESMSDEEEDEEEEEEEDEGEDEEEGSEQGYTVEEESEDELQESIGVELNQRLLLAIAARARGEQVVLDDEWEQWMKEAAERGVAAGFAGVNDGRVH